MAHSRRGSGSLEGAVQARDRVRQVWGRSCDVGLRNPHGWNVTLWFALRRQSLHGVERIGLAWHGQRRRGGNLWRAAPRSAPFTPVHRGRGRGGAQTVTGPGRGPQIRRGRRGGRLANAVELGAPGRERIHDGIFSLHLGPGFIDGHGHGLRHGIRHHGGHGPEG